MLQVPLPQPKTRHTLMGTPCFYFRQRLAENYGLPWVHARNVRSDLLKNARKWSAFRRPDQRADTRCLHDYQFNQIKNTIANKKQSCFLIYIRKKFVERYIKSINKRDDITCLRLVDVSLPVIYRFLAYADDFA